MIVQWLSIRDDGDDYLASYMYQTIQNTMFPDSENAAKSYALRLLIHYIGDIHQPFHAESLYSSTFPDGDKGGNLFTLPSHYASDELHAVWDQQMYSEHNHISRPINQSAWDAFQPRVITLMQNGASAVVNPSDYKNINVDDWALETYKIGITKYTGIEMDVALPQWYIDENLVVCNQRITLGGYRLAYLTEYIYGKDTSLFLQ